MPVNYKLRDIARESERERTHAMMCFQQRTKTWARTGFTIDFTFYKVRIIMFMADVCYIFIYIIKWFLKSPACFRSHTKYENNFNWSMPILLNKYDEKNHCWSFIGSVFKKNKHLKAIWLSQITQSISGIAFEHKIKH